MSPCPRRIYNPKRSLAVLLAKLMAESTYTTYPGGGISFKLKNSKEVVSGRYGWILIC